MVFQHMVFYQESTGNMENCNTFCHASNQRLHAPTCHVIFGCVSTGYEPLPTMILIQKCSCLKKLTGIDTFGLLEWASNEFKICFVAATSRFGFRDEFRGKTDLTCR